MNFRDSFSFSKLIYPFLTIYSANARKQIRKIINEFKPDVAHLNNINFQITPSIIYELKKHGIPVVWTAHDYQLVCPNHMMFIPEKSAVCTDCENGKFSSCIKNKCLHGSTAKSAIAAAESYFYRFRHTYKLVDKMICPSKFMQNKIEMNPDLQGKTEVLYNFVEAKESKQFEKQDYVLYFGRYDLEKGIDLVIESAKKLPNIQFVFAGRGDLERELEGIPNIKNVGFLSGDELIKTISSARCAIDPSVWYENCPFSVIESQLFMTPVIGADIGGIPELIDEGKTGYLFNPGDSEDLTAKISAIFENPEKTEKMSENCKLQHFDTLETYTQKLLKIYSEVK